MFQSLEFTLTCKCTVVIDSYLIIYLACEGCHSVVGGGHACKFVKYVDGKFSAHLL